jgi:Tfp pilus assembly protein PilX
MSELRRRSAGEEGFVMVVTVIVMALALIITGVAISDTMSARRITEKDRRAESAQQAADAGLQIGLYRANQMSLGTTNFNGGLTGVANTLGCLVPVTVAGTVTSFTTVALGVQTSCPTSPQPPPGGSGCTPTPCWNYEVLGNRTQVATMFIPGQKSNGPSSTTGHASLNPVIVSIGRDTNGTATTSDDVLRRVEAVLNPVEPFDMIEATGNLSFGGVATTLNGDVRANGNLSVGLLGSLIGANVLGSDGSLLRLASVEYGLSYSGLLTVANLVHTTTPFTRSPVSISPSKPDCWNGSGTQGTAGACPAAASYSSVTHKLNVTSGQTVTLGAGDYVFCGVSVVAASGFLGLTPGGTLNTSATAAGPTRIFIDSPTSTRCSGASPSSTPLSLLGKLNTISTTPSAMQMYVVGNGTAGGTSATIDATLGSTLTPAFFLYAPDTNVSVKASIFMGNVIGHDVAFSGSLATVLSQDLGLYNMPLTSSLGIFTRKQYIQCTATEPPASNPTKDC